MSISLWLGMTIRVSTLSLRFSIPSSAWTRRRAPSKRKGLVTTATVRAPTSFLAISAMMGAAPVPVPPPSPAVMKTMSAPTRTSLIFSRDSSAAWAPISGFDPEPRPLVPFSPIWSLISALEFINACISVLTAINSTPLIFPEEIMEFMALLPPPPTPRTFILAKVFVSGLTRPTLW